MAKTKITTEKHSESNKHLAVLYGNSSGISGLMAGLQYDGLAVIGAIPLDVSGKSPTHKHETENYLIGVISDIVTQTDPDISNIHLLRLPCDVSLDAVHIVSELTKMELGCNISNIKVETEGGCRAFLEESCSLIPSSVSEDEVSELRKEVDGHIPILVVEPDNDYDEGPSHSGSYVHAVGEADLEENVPYAPLSDCRIGDQGSGGRDQLRLDGMENRLSEACSKLYEAEREVAKLRKSCKHLLNSIKGLAADCGLL